MRGLKFLSILTIIVGFTMCKSLQFKKQPPFKITSATYKDWVGGQPGISGIILKINYTSNLKIEFDRVYFRNKETQLESKKVKTDKLVVGYFNTSSLKKDFILDANPTKELNNPVPKIKKIPFKLTENEAVISYKFNGKLEYYKIKSLLKEN